MRRIVEAEEIEPAPGATGSSAKKISREQVPDSQATSERPARRVRHRFATPSGEA